MCHALATGMTERDLSYLPVGIVLPIRDAIYQCRCNPPSDWPEEAYVLIGKSHEKKHIYEMCNTGWEYCVKW